MAGASGREAVQLDPRLRLTHLRPSRMVPRLPQKCPDRLRLGVWPGFRGTRERDRDCCFDVRRTVPARFPPFQTFDSVSLFLAPPLAFALPSGPPLSMDNPTPPGEPGWPVGGPRNPRRPGRVWDVIGFEMTPVFLTSAPCFLFVFARLSPHVDNLNRRPSPGGAIAGCPSITFPTRSLVPHSSALVSRTAPLPPPSLRICTSARATYTTQSCRLCKRSRAVGPRQPVIGLSHLLARDRA